MTWWESISGMVLRRMPPKPTSIIPKGLTHRYVRLAVLSKLSDDLTLEMIGGAPVVMAHGLPMPLRVFLIVLANQMAIRTVTFSAISKIEEDVISFWKESGVPENYHAKASRDGWAAVEQAVRTLVSEWRKSPDAIQTFSDAMRHMDDLYALAKARSDEEAAMMEATLSSGSS